MAVDTRPDPRRHAWRDDLAAEDLRNVVHVPRYTRGVPHLVTSAVAPLRHAPRPDAALDTEALLGETVIVYDQQDGWAWGQLARDRYVGYLPSQALTDNLGEPTHRVAAPGTIVFAQADIKSLPLMHLSLNARVAVAEAGERLSRLADGGYIITRHIAPHGRYASDDFVAVAELLLGTPYLWGGRTRLGVDCSGLVQLSLEAAGISAPRDSDMQAAELGGPVATGESYQGLQRGDLVCWRGHIGIMRDALTLLHANAHHMAVASEPLAEAVARIAAAGGRPISVRRLEHITA